MLTTRQGRAHLAVSLLIVAGISVASMLSNLDDTTINFTGGIAYTASLVSSAITLFAVNIATYQRR